MNISQKLRMLRKRNNLTLKELSIKSGISISFISDIENGRRTPSIEKLKILASALDIPASEFLEEDNNSIKSSHKENIKNNQVEQSNIEYAVFKTPEAAIQFILKQPAIAAYGGFDLNKMSDNEIMDFANELLHQLKLLGYKYQK